MKTIERIVIPASREAVFDVLADASRYVEWVVGANRLRRIDPEWPAPGSRFHHTVGIRPFELRDDTEIRDLQPPAHVELRVRVRPFFEALVELDLEDLGPRGTLVTMTEEPTGGLAALAGPLNLPALSLRNRLALRRLAKIVAQQQAA